MRLERPLPPDFANPFPTSSVRGTNAMTPGTDHLLPPAQLTLSPEPQAEEEGCEDFCRMRGKGNDLRGFKDFCIGNGSRRGQSLALTVLCVPIVLAPDSLTVLFVTNSLDPEYGLECLICAEFARPIGRGGGVPGSV